MGATVLHNYDKLRLKLISLAFPVLPQKYKINGCTLNLTNQRAARKLLNDQADPNQAPSSTVGFLFLKRFH